MNALDQLRAFVRYKTHGGYRWAAVLADGELVCEVCAKANYRQIFRATKAGGKPPHNDDWQVIGLANSGEADIDGHDEICVQCGKILWAKVT